MHGLEKNKGRQRTAALVELCIPGLAVGNVGNWILGVATALNGSSVSIYPSLAATATKYFSAVKIYFRICGKLARIQFLQFLAHDIWVN